MKIALAYDYLNQWGGGERVLREIAGMFPEAPIYTLFYGEEKTRRAFAGRKIITSFLDFPLVKKRHRAFIPLMPLAAGSIKISSDYDAVISVGAAYAHGISYQPKTRHLHYCFTPLRYAWEDDFLPPTLASVRAFIYPVKNYLKRWDYRSAQRPGKIITISHFIADKISKSYGREAEIIYPPINEKFFFDETIVPQDYFLAVGRLLHYKKFDFIVEVFNELRLPLKIVGIGPEMNRLRRLIKSPLIEMVGFVGSDDDLRKIYAGAQAFIFPQAEDFGLVAAEAQACGTPVIAFAAGGALEIIEKNVSGLFFKSQTRESLKEAVNNFLSRKFNPRIISQSAARFSTDRFKEEFDKKAMNWLYSYDK